MTQRMAHVICLNNSVECVVVDSLEVANATMAGLAKIHQERKGCFNDDDYKARFYWHIHTIPAIGNGSPRSDATGRSGYVAGQ
jgi:hypothetical protein